MFVTVSSFLHYLRLTVKIFQFLRLSTKFLAVLRLSVNPTETLFIPFTLLFACYFPAVSVNILLKSCPPMNHVAFLETAFKCGKTHSFRQKILKKANGVKGIEAKQLSFIHCLFCYYLLVYFIFNYTIFFTLDFFK